MFVRVTDLLAQMFGVEQNQDASSLVLLKFPHHQLLDFCDTLVYQVGAAAVDLLELAKEVVLDILIPVDGSFAGNVANTDQILELEHNDLARELRRKFIDLLDDLLE
ncbi:hypothetical protein HG530_015730 [Fusarium avenaceum]|nr:hypothetical protein HG530_015730 [Fusarium avenaceum]